MNGVVFKNAKNLFEEKNDVLGLQLGFENIPPYIYQEMVESGMFDDENKVVDNYINEDALEVVLDDETWALNPKKFIETLKKAMEKNLDDIVCSVISEFGNEPQIISTIISSGIHKYILEVIDMPKDLYYLMIKGEDNADNEVLKFIKSDAVDCWAEQFVIVKTGCEKWISALLKNKVKFQLSFDEIKEILSNQKLLLKLAKKRDLDVSFQIDLINLNNEAVIFELLEQPCLYAVIKDKIAKLGNEKYLSKLLDNHTLTAFVQEKVAKTGNKELIVKLLRKVQLRDMNFNAFKIITGKKYYSGNWLFEHDFYLCSILEMDIEEYTDAIINLVNQRKNVVRWILDTEDDNLISKIDEKVILEYKRFDGRLKEKYAFNFFEQGCLSYLQQVEIVRSNNEEHILKLIERNDLNHLVEAQIVETGNELFISKLFERRKLGYLAQVAIVDSNDEKYILKLIERSELNPLVQAQIVRTRKDIFVSKLFERIELNYLAQVAIVESKNEEHILKLIERSDLNPLVEAQIVKTGKDIFISKLKERRVFNSMYDDAQELSCQNFVSELLESDDCEHLINERCRKSESNLKCEKKIIGSGTKVTIINNGKTIIIDRGDID